MVLRRTKEEIQQEHIRLGIEYRKLIRLLIDLCKGRVYSEKYDWFYNQFIGREHYGIPDTVDGVREGLRTAWWIEEEDIRQEILIITYTERLVIISTSPHSLIVPLAHSIRDWLLEQKAFSHLKNWWEKYDTTSEKEKMFDLSFLFSKEYAQNISLFNRYLLYLSHVLELPREKISETILAQTRQVNRFKLILKQEMENCYGKS